MPAFVVKKIAVLGAGVMGAQIAAHCVNAGFKTLLFDLAEVKGDHNEIVLKSIANLSKLKPTPLATPTIATLLTACNYEDDLNQLTDCSLIIEAIAERLDWKESLYKRIAPYLTENTILVSNTSGLSINSLASIIPSKFQSNFCGVHFFNPPRYMHLAELIPAEKSTPELLDKLETWLTSHLGKGVVRAKDTPNFIANRIGVFSLLATLAHADAMQLGLDEVDALTGSLIGRPKSATFRTMDVVGLDTMAHVVATMQNQLVDDPWHASYILPNWLNDLIKQGHLGQKSGQGIYRKNGAMIEVFDGATGSYRPANGEVAEEIKAILKNTNFKMKMQQLLASTHPQARFLVACFRDLFHYSAYHLKEIASSVRDVDLAMRWGFGWQMGPFETWQAMGISEMIVVIKEALSKHCALATANLPDWLTNIDNFYEPTGAYSPSSQTYQAMSKLPVYEKQLLKESSMIEPKKPRKTIFENEGVLLWELEKEILVASFKSKANSIGQSVIDGMHESLSIAENTAQGLIIYQNDVLNFSSGADLKSVGTLIHAKKWSALETMLHQFQQLMMRLKYSTIPTIAALRGRALGGGCEMMLACSKVVAAFESYPGLVEVGVGLIPAGGGTTEMAKRASFNCGMADLNAFIRPYFEQIAKGLVASSAPDALEKGYLQLDDGWVMHPDEVLFAAVHQIKAMRALNHTPPLAAPFKVVGREGHAILQIGLVNWLEGGFISNHDYLIANQLATVMCGGNVNQGTLVDEKWMLQLEREAFMTLAATPSTEARIGYLLETGKPLRN